MQPMSSNDLGLLMVWLGLLSIVCGFLRESGGGLLLRESEGGLLLQFPGQGQENRRSRREDCMMASPEEEGILTVAWMGQGFNI